MIDLGGKYTESQKAASLKYLKEKTDDVRVRVPSGTKGEWQTIAKAQNKSLQRFVIDAVEAEIERLKKGG